VSRESALKWLEGRVTEDHGCLVWNGSYGGQKRDTPMARLPEGNRSARKLVLEITTGRKMKKGFRTFAKCETFGCVHPDCLTRETYCFHQKGKAMDASGTMKMVKNIRGSAKLNPENVKAIRDEEIAVQAVRCVDICLHFHLLFGC